ncbi:MAG: dihydrolipoyl dehydrogenase [Christensenellales bacterium]
MYDLIIIGAGPGGYEAAIRASQNGMSVLLFEKDQVGGTCLNWGCVPTKALMHAASLFAQFGGAEAWGIAGQPSLDAEKMYLRKDAVVQSLRSGIDQLLRQHKVTVVNRQAKLISARQVMAGGERYEGERLLIASGSLPVMPPIPGLDLPGVIKSDEIIARPFKGKHLAILGGGVIGTEIASLYLNMGVQVSIIEALQRVLPQMEREISQTVAMKMKRVGAALLTGKKLLKVAQDADGLRLSLEGSDEPLACDGLLVCVGRRANTDGLFQEGFMPPLMEKGRILTDGLGQTSIPGIYAIGDVSSTIQLAHLASAQGIALADRLAGLPESVDLALVPSCVYTDPEIACVGLDEETARQRGIAVKTGKYLMSGNSRTTIVDGGRSYIKVICAQEDERILGAQLVCERASDLVDEFTLAISNSLSLNDMLRGIRPHPSFSEGIREALESVHGRAIHMAPAKNQS